MTTWVEFWDGQDLFSEALLQRGVEHFLERSQVLMQPGPTDRVLDVGCGPGELVGRLRERVQEVHGVDTSAAYIRRCQERFAGALNVFFHRLDETDYTDLSCLSGKVFSRVYCHSVVQYYDRLERVARLIDAVGERCSPGARFLIADIPLKAGALPDLAAFLWRSLHGPGLREALRTVVRSASTGYASLPRLCFSQTDLEQLMAGRRGRILDQALTVNPRRKHLLIEF